MMQSNRFMKPGYGVLLAGAVIAIAVAGCGGDDDTCDAAAQTGCSDGQVCELVVDGEPACFAPLVLRGSVTDLADDSAVEAARVVALDANGAAVSSVALSDADGEYELAIPSTRQSDGTPVALELTLRVAASGYQTFPSGLRQALPVDTGTATVDGERRVVQSALTDVGLLAMPDGSGTGSISGVIETPDDPVGILVVATSGGEGFSGIANRDGEYRIFNLPAGDYDVDVYARGLSYDAGNLTLGDGEDAEVNLGLSSVATGIVAGDVQIVNAPGGSVTSVVLVVESTFDELLARGQTVPGLRAPEPGVAANIEGAYSIEGVPAGRYVVLAAFENDRLVRDPDLSIGGTSILHIEVTPGQTTTVAGFKVTEALEIFGPGARDPEAVSGQVTFSWNDDSSEDQYLVEVFDAFGERIWDQTMDGVSGADPTMDYAGPPLEAGMFYQFRVTSSKDGTPISRTEDLAGVFFLP